MKLHCLCKEVSYGNWDNYWGPAFVGVDNLDLYSPGEIPNGKIGSQIPGSDPRTMNFTGALYPNGIKWLSGDYKKNYPLTTYGAAGMTQKGWANYAFVDGHAEGFPDQTFTNPDPIGRSTDNQWDANR